MTNGSKPTNGRKPRLGSAVKKKNKSVTRGVRTKKSVHWGECVVSGIQVISRLTKEQVCGVIGDDNYYALGQAWAKGEKAKKKAEEARLDAEEAKIWAMRTLTRADLADMDLD